MKRQKFAGVTGIPLSRRALGVLKAVGIFAHPLVSLEHQHLAQLYVIRGVESGGATRDVGRYVTFAGEQGEQLSYLHPVEAIAVNGIHAVVISPTLVRVDMVRKARTYELLITRHAPSTTQNGQRPTLESTVLFRGFHGRIELDLSGKDRSQAGSVVPTFYSLAGEITPVPEQFTRIVRASTLAVNCVGCAHSHYLSKSRVVVAGAADTSAVGSDRLAECEQKSETGHLSGNELAGVVS